MATEPQAKTAPTYTQRTTCRLCSKPTLSLVLNLGDQYLANFVGEKNPLLPRAPLMLMRCTDCGLLQLRDTVDGSLLWQKDYWYRSGINATMRAALADVVDSALQHKLEGGVWVDIGANDGTLLSRVPNDFVRIGVDPEPTFKAQLEEHADLVVQDYFSAKVLPHPADVITSCAMFYDLEDPHAFVEDIAKSLTPTGIWVNQLNDAPTMLKQNAWDAICHEHRTYWDIPNLKRLYEQHGLYIQQVTYNDVNGGSVRILASKNKVHGDSPTLGIQGVTPHQVSMFSERARRWKMLAQELLSMPGFSTRPIWGYGASTKGCTILQYLDLNDRFIAIADRNPIKHGSMMAGTWIPVTDEVQLRRSDPAIVFVLIWAFRDEILKREAELLERGSTFLFSLPNLELVT